MRYIAFGGLLLLAGLAVEIWITIIGMSDAFVGGVRLPSSFDDLCQDWLYFGLIFGLPVVAIFLGITAIKFWRKKPADASDK